MVTNGYFMHETLLYQEKELYFRKESSATTIFQLQSSIGSTQWRYQSRLKPAYASASAPTPDITLTHTHTHTLYPRRFDSTAPPVRLLMSLFACLFACMDEQQFESIAIFVDVQ
jgi:hypothetical protein